MCVRGYMSCISDGRSTVVAACGAVSSSTGEHLLVHHRRRAAGDHDDQGCMVVMIVVMMMIVMIVVMMMLMMMLMIMIIIIIMVAGGWLQFEPRIHGRMDHRQCFLFRCVQPIQHVHYWYAYRYPCTHAYMSNVGTWISACMISSFVCICVWWYVCMHAYIYVYVMI